MPNYDLIAAMHKFEPDSPFNPKEVSKMTVKQVHLLAAKLTIIRDASKSAEKRHRLQVAADALLAVIPDLQSGDLNTAITNSDRPALLFSDVEMAHESVGCVLAVSNDPNRAFWLVGNGKGGVDVTGVVKKN